MSDLGDVSQVEKVVYLGGSGEKISRNSRVEFECGLGQNVSNWLHILLEVLQFLVDHCAKDAPDLGLLQTEMASFSLSQRLLVAAEISGVRWACSGSYVREGHVDEVKATLQAL